MTTSSPDPEHSEAPMALVIEPAVPHLLAILGALSSTGFDVTVAETYEEARTVLTTHTPLLLVTGLKLREYNGLHLVLRARAIRADMAAVVVSDTADPVLMGEAEKLGATFVVMPTTHEEMVAAICRTVLRPPGSSAEPIRPPFERRRTPGREGCSLPEEERKVQERRADVQAAIRTLVR
jgi:ActR/RegA family two-component response regulator